MDTIQRRDSSSSRFRGLRTKLVLSLLVAMLALPALAVAQSPTDEQYGGSDAQILQQTGGGGPSGGPSDPGDSSDPGLGGNVGPLPFTGFDVIAMAAVALTVAGIGLALQRAVARE
jgi:hypothetical protein